MHCKPWGLEDGGEAAGNGIGLRREGKWETEFPNAKVFNVRLKAGDAYMMRSGGGGGFGRATERDPQLVARDVHEGYVSRKVALDTYRVVIDGDGTADSAATRALRARTDIAPAASAEAADDTGPQLDMTPG